MLTPTIRQILTKVEELENSLQAPEVERLEVWRNLIVWLNYAKNYDNELEALKALEPGDRLRELHNSLLWSFRHFVLLLPDDIKRADYWPEKCKLLIECYIIGALNADVQISELQQEIYLDDCIKFVIEMVRNPDNWREFDRAKHDQWKPKPKPAEAPEEPVTLINNPVIDNPIESDSASSGEVSANELNFVEAEYIGGYTGIFIQTSDGLQKVEKGKRYRLPVHIWENIQEFAKIEWRKVR